MIDLMALVTSFGDVPAVTGAISVALTAADQAFQMDRDLSAGVKLIAIWRGLGKDDDVDRDALLLWSAEHRERLLWARSLILARQPSRALIEIEAAITEMTP